MILCLFMPRVSCVLFLFVYVVKKKNNVVQFFYFFYWYTNVKFNSKIHKKFAIFCHFRYIWFWSNASAFLHILFHTTFSILKIKSHQKSNPVNMQRVDPMRNQPEYSNKNIHFSLPHLRWDDDVMTDRFNFRIFCTHIVCCVSDFSVFFQHKPMNELLNLPVTS